jgi:hypothetical protein
MTRTIGVVHSTGEVPHGIPKAQLNGGQVQGCASEVPHGWLRACPYEGVSSGLHGHGGTCFPQTSIGRWERYECSHEHGPCGSSGAHPCSRGKSIGEMDAEPRRGSKAHRNHRVGPWVATAVGPSDS